MDEQLTSEQDVSHSSYEEETSSMYNIFQLHRSYQSYPNCYYIITIVHMLQQLHDAKQLNKTTKQATCHHDERCTSQSLRLSKARLHGVAATSAPNDDEAQYHHECSRSRSMINRRNSAVHIQMIKDRKVYASSYLPKTKSSHPATAVESAKMKMKVNKTMEFHQAVYIGKLG